jgi:hypothetical protein
MRLPRVNQVGFDPLIENTQALRGNDGNVNAPGFSGGPGASPEKFTNSDTCPTEADAMALVRIKMKCVPDDFPRQMGYFVARFHRMAVMAPQEDRGQVRHLSYLNPGRTLPNHAQKLDQQSAG